MESKYHKGELYLQDKFGESQIATRLAGMIKSEVIESAIPFLENQTFVIVSSKDTNGQIWSSILMGRPGWINASVLGRITLSLDSIASPISDVFFSNLKSQNQIGILFIELGTRRRYRVNGKVELCENSLKVLIKEAYPNCPKYINRRVLNATIQNSTAPPINIQGGLLNDFHKEWISNADTFFVSSASTQGSMDASHRGGKKGFIEILPDGVLKIPDYKGNSLYNTMGNFYEMSESGLIFIDFENGSVLQLTGRATFLFDQVSEADLQKTTGTGRYWLFKTEEWIQTDNHNAMTWEYLDASPFNPL